MTKQSQIIVINLTKLTLLNDNKNITRELFKYTLAACLEIKFINVRSTVVKLTRIQKVHIRR